MKFLIPFCIVFVLFNCTSEDGSYRSSIQGTWTGTLDSNRIVEYKVYSPNLEDSLTKLVDSVYTMNGVLVDFGREEAQFFGMRSIIFSPHVYRWEGKDTILFQKIRVSKEVLRDGSGEVDINAYLLQPYAAIIKRDKDSLVMRLAVYKGDWKQYVLKLKKNNKRLTVRTIFYDPLIS